MANIIHVNMPLFAGVQPVMDRLATVADIHGWGIQKLRSAYTGYACQVTMVDQLNAYVATADVQFDSDGHVHWQNSVLTNVADTNGTYPDSDLQNWAGDMDTHYGGSTDYSSSDIAVSKFYYQGTGSGNDLTQATFASMPLIYEYDPSTPSWFDWSSATGGPQFTGGTSGATYLNGTLGASAGGGFNSEAFAGMHVSMPASQAAANLYLFGENQGLGFTAGIGTNLSGSNPHRPYMICHTSGHSWAYVDPAADMTSSSGEWIGANMHRDGATDFDWWNDGVDVSESSSVTAVFCTAPPAAHYSASGTTQVSLGSQDAAGNYGASMYFRSLIIVDDVLSSADLAEVKE